MYYLISSLILRIFASNKTYFLCVVLFCPSVYAQKQLIILKRNEVVQRFIPGDDFVYKKEDDRRIYVSYVNNLSDTAIVTHNDTVPYHRIERVYFEQKMFLNTLGKLLMIGGVGYFLVDQINNVFVYGNGFRLDRDVNRVTVIGVSAGVPLFFIRKKSVKIGYKYRLVMVKEGSVLYLENPPEAQR